MRYILVNHRVPKVNRFCAFCAGRLTDSYLRELGTRIKYCKVACYEAHCIAAMLAAGGIHGEVTETVRLLPGPPRVAHHASLGPPVLLPKAP